MITFDLFENGIFAIPVWNCSQSNISIEPPFIDPVVYRSEKQDLLKELEGKSRAVVLQKLKGRVFSVIPYGSISAAILCDLSFQDKSSFPFGMFADPHDKVKAKDGRIHLSLDSLIAKTIEESAAYKFLLSLSLDVVISPSFQNWLVKEHRRRVVEATPFLLDEIVDSRPLEERAEPGTLLYCKESSNGFQAGTTYLVLDVPSLFSIEPEKKQDAEDSKDEEKNDTVIKIARYDMLKESAEISESLSWPITDPMGDFFQLHSELETIYNFDNSIPGKYPEQFSRNLKELKNEPIFEHSKHDVAQAAFKRRYFLGNPMRFGKSRESLSYAKLRKAKRVAFITAKNVRPFIVRDDLKPMGIDSYQVIDSILELKPRKEQPWLEILTYSWLKGSKPKSGIISIHKECPHCEQLLQRPILRKSESYNKIEMHGWTANWGYCCRNQQCFYQKQDVLRDRKRGDKKGSVFFGAAWQSQDLVIHGKPNKGSSYVDIDRKVHAMHFAGKKFDGSDSDNVSFYGQKCKQCGLVASEWVPPRYKKLRKRYTCIIADEIHMAKAGFGSDLGNALLGMAAPLKVALTGTLMPNTPMDAYWPLEWAFGSGSPQFKYFRTGRYQNKGINEFVKEFTSSVEVQTKEGKGYRKKVPFLKAPVRFWKWMAPKMIRRSNESPLRIESLKKAGLYAPTVKLIPYNVNPDPEQAKLMALEGKEFEEYFRDYTADLEEKSEKDGIQRVVNPAMILSKMYRMREMATIPDVVNFRLKKRGVEKPFYTGGVGGGKLRAVFDLCASKIKNGSKVLILSNFRYNTELLEKELEIFNPIRFDTTWKTEKRQEAFDLFRDDPNRHLFIAGPMAVGVGVDLSVADTVICTDLLWRPGDLAQSWSRILKPRPVEKNCEIYLMLTKYSLEPHMYSTFYAKDVAAGQALDRKVVRREDKTFNVVAFTERVISERKELMQWMQDNEIPEITRIPILDMRQREDRVA